MLIHHGAVRRAVTALGMAGLLTGASILFTPGTALAEQVATNCSSTVTGKMGETVSITGKSVKEYVRTSAEKAQGVDNLLVYPDGLADEIEAKGELKVGTVPKAASGSISGAKIADVVAVALKDSSYLGSNPDKTLSYIEKGVADKCALSLRASNYVAPTGSTPPTSGTTAPGTTPPGGNYGAYPGIGTSPFDYGTGTSRAPRNNYGGLPFAMPGATTNNGSGSLVPGAVPEFGGGGLPPASTDPAVSNAGNADPLGHGDHGEEVQLPMLLAVVALAGVAAALVRTWVLRRV